ncbi:MAG: GTPase HflX [Anaerolineae bacterium]|nr:GTPase HflX [Anaerolineae bacterium]
MVGAQLKRPQDGRLAWKLEDSLDELAQLAWTAGVEVVGRTTQQLERIHPATFIGKGKVEELQELRDDLGFNVVIFDDELSPRQQRELEKALGDGVKVLDRTALILDIFARHAHTREGALQVELAQYEYRLPRLTRAWTHLARQAGGAAGRGGIGGVGLRGPGETQLEVDQREIRRRIAHLRRELEEVRTHRRQYRQRRQREAIPVVALVGYTNAGKSTLLNALAGSDVWVEDKLFATLDPTTRRVTLPGGRVVLFTDTVGFIQKLPTMLVAAFRATLEEINEADVLLHVVDITHPNVRQQSHTVGEVLNDLGATSAPIIVALNKIDRLPDPDAVAPLLSEFPNSLAISALKGWGLTELLARVEELLETALVPLTVHIPYREAGLLALFHQRGTVEREEHGPEGTLVQGRLPAALLGRFRPFLLHHGTGKDA